VVTFNSGGNMNITVHGNQTINEYHVAQELKKELQEEFETHNISEPIQQDLVEAGQDLVEAIEHKEPSKFQKILEVIREKGPEVADIVISKALTYAIGLL
jgi:hypothetical protein